MTESAKAADRYRDVDRQLKAMLKYAEEQTSTKQRKKRAWEEAHGINRSEDERSPTKDTWPLVVDPRKATCTLVERVATLPKCCSTRDHVCSYAGRTSVYKLSAYPSGLYVVTHALCPEEQHRLAKSALEDYSKEDHTNLSNLSRLAETTADPSIPVGDFTDIWRKSCLDNDGFQRLRKLRWSCLGYHYDWTKRSYQRDLKSVFPADFANLCVKIAESIGQDIVPEAAIVNYYPVGSCMGGHIDDAEHDLEKPIVSISLGRSAIFLIGGQTKDVVPSPILVRSGDAVVMTGESRLCYHGIAGILSSEVERFLTKEPMGTEDDGINYPEKSSEDAYVTDYLRSHRINLNVRQVRIGLSDDNWLDKTGSGYQPV